MRIKYIRELDWPSSNLSLQHPMSQLASQTQIAPNIVAVCLVEMLLLFGLGVKYIKIGLNWVDVFVEDLPRCRSSQSEIKLPKMLGHHLCY